MSEDKHGHEVHPANEYEREPVPEKARLGFKSFIGMYAVTNAAMNISVSLATRLLANVGWTISIRSASTG